MPSTSDEYSLCVSLLYQFGKMRTTVSKNTNLELKFERKTFGS